MKTKHIITVGNSNDMSTIEDNSIELVVTSPPYPMIEMWDEIFSLQNPEIEDAINSNNSKKAFDLMHNELYKVWKELYRVVKPGCFVCINIGDATRTMNKIFQLHMNNVRITSQMLELGFISLPPIIWKKTTNAPNKFMGSGMLPAGAYVTLENEYILIFRKGGKREFKTLDEKQNRRNSAFFWNERNLWFSNIWEIRGEVQKTKNGEKRERSAAYPLELTNRLINMYSVYGDTVLDPFFGTGTTTHSAALLGRNSYGYEIDNSFALGFQNRLINLQFESISYNSSRLNKQKDFIKNYHKDMKYYNDYIKIGVMTSQEKEMVLYEVDSFDVVSENEYEIKYKRLYND
jgi:DNA modification methylase